MSNNNSVKGTLRGNPSLPENEKNQSASQFLPAKNESGSASALPRSISKEHVVNVAVNENDIMGNISVEAADGTTMEFSFSSKTTARVSDENIMMRTNPY
jgi:hypothetical protein